MSQYPYGYGFQGQQPQQQYSYQPYGAYSAAPGHGAQQPQQPQQSQRPPQPPPTTGNYYAATQSAYDYNANNIPGLGAPPAGPLFPVHFNGTWDQSGYGTNSVSAQYPPYIPVPTTSTPASYTNKQNEAPASRDPDPPSQHRQNQSRVQTKAPQIQRLAEQSKQQPKDVDSQEEGEISDGQFDDLYDDLSNQPSNPHPLTVASASGKSSEDGVATGTDQEPNFYDTDVEELPASKSQPTVTSRGKVLGSDVALAQTEPSRVERDRSRSYSPYLSPREVEQDIVTPETTKVGSGTQQLAYRGVNNEASAGYDQHAGQKVHGADRREEDEVASKGPAAARTSPRSFKTLAEAQNEAKKTILRLLPLGVKYQTYLDEGIDQNVVKDLFVQLNLAPPAPSSTAPEKPIATLEQNTPGPKQQPTETSQADDKAKQQEERKDKIARLLAEKKAKAAAAASTASKAPVTPVSSETSSPSIKPKTQSEKNLLLQQKMEALRKAHEERAQKAKQQHAAAQVSKPEVVEKDATRPATEESTATAHSAAVSTSAAAKPAPVAQNLPHDGSGTTSVPVQPTLGIQSPVLPSPLTKPGTQRKRPVAADFVDYPSPAIKRPFLPSRQDSSLVISVSDDDEDDNDVDMEVVSPAEDSSASAQQSFNLPKGGPSLRDYPPLTNRGAQRQLSSPAPGTPNGRTTMVDLQAQERAIADLRRRIEEAEARKKSKPKTGSATPQTPSAGNVTPIDQGANQPAHRAVSTSELDDKNGPSAQLLHEAEAAKLPKDVAASHVEERPESERQSPPSSAQISNFTAIDAKVARIKQMEEELKSLRAEVEETMAEQTRPEVDQPASDSAAESVADHQPIHAAATPSGDSDRMQLDDNSYDAASQSHPMEIESSEESSDEMETVPKKPQVNPPEVLADIATNGVEGSDQDFGSVDLVQSSIAGGQSAEAPSAIAVTPPTGVLVSAVEEDASDDYEPPDAQTDDRPVADSPPFSPAPAENASSLEATQLEAQDLISPIPMPTQISTANMPNDDPATEAHAEFFSHPSSRVEEISREDAEDAAPTPQTSFVDYESPLRYFHAYRFHPAYNHNVAGGLKSLTYSNRIDPKREVCPDELDGQDCPRGSACQFQHFQNMTAPDNLIILELGSSDDLIGDQKKNFNNALRELVSSFQKSKVRDFKTIAEGIVEFRRRFLGDPTRILHLDGVTI